MSEPQKFGTVPRQYDVQFLPDHQWAYRNSCTTSRDCFPEKALRRARASRFRAAKTPRLSTWTIKTW